MQEPLDRELILRRIQVERARGTPFDELMDIIQDMVESQRLAAYLAANPGCDGNSTQSSAGNILPPPLVDEINARRSAYAMEPSRGQTALMRLLAEIRACKVDRPRSYDIRRQGVETVLEILGAYGDNSPAPSDRSADDK